MKYFNIILNQPNVWHEPKVFLFILKAIYFKNFIESYYVHWLNLSGDTTNKKKRNPKFYNIYIYFYQ